MLVKSTLICRPERLKRSRKPASRTKLEKDQSGRVLCRFCRKPVKPPRRTFCNDQCVDEWLIRTTPSVFRDRIFKRDRGVCSVCRLDTLKLYHELVLMQRTSFSGFRDRMQELGLKRLELGVLWQADHILEVSRGGGSCGLKNGQTLCWKCHADKTASLKSQPKEFVVMSEKESSETPRLPIEEFVSLGILQEVNRQFLHPLGLALEVLIDDSGRATLSGVWDFRNDPEGIVFCAETLNTDEARRKEASVESLRSRHVEERLKLMGAVIQPIPKTTES